VAEEQETERRPKRSTLPKDEAKRRYVEMAELAVLEQIRRDSQRLDDGSEAVGPFARLDAADVAARDGKTRGAITNLFGSQRVFRAETMALALSAQDWVRHSGYPSPAQFPDAEAWLDALLVGQSARGPLHGTDPVVDYASLWALWLSAVPYGLWSEEVSRSSLDEYRQSVAALVDVLGESVHHFGVTLREGVTVEDLASALESMIEGIWLNQCLTTAHPCDPTEPIATAMRRSGRLLWHGATVSDVPEG
jgi:hypothetical protein